MEIKNDRTCILSSTCFAAAATVDENGLPFSDAVELLDWDENGIYFIADRTTEFYRRLSQKGVISVTGTDGGSAGSRTVFTLRGSASELGTPFLPRLLKKSPCLEQSYPSQISRKVLTVFCISRGTGEISRSGKTEPFSFGADQEKKPRYFITDRCVLCRFCYSKCPQKCIDISHRPAVIRQESCMHCGNCYEICLARAIEKRPAE